MNSHEINPQPSPSVSVQTNSLDGTSKTIAEAANPLIPNSNIVTPIVVNQNPDNQKGQDIFNSLRALQESIHQKFSFATGVVAYLENANSKLKDIGDTIFCLQKKDLAYFHEGEPFENSGEKESKELFKIAFLILSQTIKFIIFLTKVIFEAKSENNEFFEKIKQCNLEKQSHMCNPSNQFLKNDNPSSLRLKRSLKINSNAFDFISEARKLSLNILKSDDITDKYGSIEQQITIQEINESLVKTINNLLISQASININETKILEDNSTPDQKSKKKKSKSIINDTKSDKNLSISSCPAHFRLITNSDKLKEITGKTNWEISSHQLKIDILKNKYKMLSGLLDNQKKAIEDSNALLDENEVTKKKLEELKVDILENEHKVYPENHFSGKKVNKKIPYYNIDTDSTTYMDIDIQIDKDISNSSVTENLPEDTEKLTEILSSSATLNINADIITEKSLLLIAKPIKIQISKEVLLPNQPKYNFDPKFFKSMIDILEILWQDFPLNLKSQKSVQKNLCIILNKELRSLNDINKYDLNRLFSVSPISNELKITVLAYSKNLMRQIYLFEFVKKIDEVFEQQDNFHIFLILYFMVYIDKSKEKSIIKKQKLRKFLNSICNKELLNKAMPKITQSFNFTNYCHEYVNRLIC